MCKGALMKSRLQGEHPYTDPAGHTPAPPYQGEWATRHQPGRWKGLTQEGQSKESHRRGVQPLSHDLHIPVCRKWSTYPWASARADRAGSDTFSAASPLVAGPCEQFSRRCLHQNHTRLLLKTEIPGSCSLPDE